MNKERLPKKSPSVNKHRENRLASRPQKLGTSQKRWPVVFWTIGVGSSIAVLLGFFWILILAKTLPPVEGGLGERKISQSTKIYDRSGTVLLYDINGGQRRTIVSSGNIPRFLKDATVAAEDENFYSEAAFDWLAVLRAAFINLIHGQILQGGSTITQQLAKNAFLSPERTLGRKLKEFLLAVQLNRRYSKDEILELYLNEIPYGSNLYGVEAASEVYFNKQVKDLNLAEAAVLAALPRAPTYYSPWGNHLKELVGRQKYILEKMYQLNKISKQELADALNTKLNFSPPSDQGIRAPHFVMAVQDYLVQKYGEDMVREGGLKVITSLDWNLQQIAEQAVADGAKRNVELYGGKNAALVAEDAKTGQIMALVGSADYFDTKNGGNFDVATQGLRQPGSALKPFVYLTAMEKGYTPETAVFDVPTEFAANNPLCPAEVNFSDTNTQCFHPQNFDEKFRGPVSFREALAQSINVPAVKVLYLAGIQDTIKNLHLFGITTLNEQNKYGLSLVLGGGAVKLIDLVGAYSVLSQEGIKHQQAMVLEVRDGDGNLLEAYQDAESAVVAPQYPRLINGILSDPQARQPLFQNSFNLTFFPEHDVALKTGTSDDYRDAWAIGYTPSLVVGVWAGNNNNSPMQKHGSSILAAVPIWHDFMQQILKDRPLETFNQPDQTTANKPVLNGDYLANEQVHSLLYYVDKNNPLGPAPENPASDPQFNNWEYGVLKWAQSNLPNFSEYNKANASSTAPEQIFGSGPAVNINKPLNGDFIENQINILAEIRGSTNIKIIRIYFNNVIVKEFTGGLGQDYILDWNFAPQNLQPQNILEIEAVDGNNLKNKSGVIIYKS